MTHIRTHISEFASVALGENDFPSDLWRYFSYQESIDISLFPGVELSGESSAACALSLCARRKTMALAAPSFKSFPFFLIIRRILSFSLIPSATMESERFNYKAPPPARPRGHGPGLGTVLKSIKTCHTLLMCLEDFIREPPILRRWLTGCSQNERMLQSRFLRCHLPGRARRMLSVSDNYMTNALIHGFDIFDVIIITIKIDFLF